MKKAAKNKISRKGDAERDLREILRKFARDTLDTQKLRDAAAKEIGSSPSYMRAMLNQRGIGGYDLWTALMVHCFEILDVDLPTVLERALKSPQRIKDANAQSPSELVFRNLDRIPIVNEDVKFQLATHLEKMLTDVNDALKSQLSRK